MTRSIKRMLCFFLAFTASMNIVAIPACAIGTRGEIPEERVMLSVEAVPEDGEETIPDIPEETEAEEILPEQTQPEEETMPEEAPSPESEAPAEVADPEEAHAETFVALLEGEEPLVVDTEGEEESAAGQANQED